MSPWTVLEHPADLAIEGRGATPAAALSAVVEGLLAHLKLGIPAPGEWEEVAVEGLDWEECAVGLLNELLYRVNVRQHRLADPQVLEWGETRVRLGFTGDRRPAAETLDTEVKAATYHGLHLARTAEGSWRLQVVFDV